MTFSYRNRKTTLVAVAAFSVLGMTSLAAAQFSGGSDGPLACQDRMAEIEDLIREKDMDIPSGALNDIFTLQQQAREACSGGSDDLALRILDELEETVLGAVEEGIPSVTPEDADAAFEADSEVTGSTITDTMSDPDAESTEEDDEDGFVQEPEGWEAPEDLTEDLEDELDSLTPETN